MLAIFKKNSENRPLTWFQNQSILNLTGAKKKMAIFEDGLNHFKFKKN